MKNKIFSRRPIYGITAVESSWGYDSSTKLKCLILRYKIDFPFSKQLINEFKGVILHLIKGDEYTEFIILMSDKKLEETFDLLCDDIIGFLRKAENERAAINGVNKKLESWKMLFSKLKNSVLSTEMQKGLFGELTFLNTLLDAGLNSGNSLLMWAGPEMERRDFLDEGIGIEIKATSANQPVLRISNETQLEITSLNHLYLCLYSLDVRRGSNNTLNELVDSIFNRFESVSEKELFRLKLSQYGYLEDDREHYSAREFIIRDTYTYEVGESFPRLIPQNIPLGVYDSSYRIELSSCEPFKIQSAIVINKIREHE